MIIVLDLVHVAVKSISMIWAAGDLVTVAALNVPFGQQEVLLPVLTLME